MKENEAEIDIKMPRFIRTIIIVMTSLSNRFLLLQLITTFI